MTRREQPRARASTGTQRAGPPALSSGSGRFRGSHRLRDVEEPVHEHADDEDRVLAVQDVDRAGAASRAASTTRRRASRGCGPAPRRTPLVHAPQRRRGSARPTRRRPRPGTRAGVRGSDAQRQVRRLRVAGRSVACAVRRFPTSTAPTFTSRSPFQTGSTRRSGCARLARPMRDHHLGDPEALHARQRREEAVHPVVELHPRRISRRKTLSPQPMSWTCSCVRQLRYPLAIFERCALEPAVVAVAAPPDDHVGARAAREELRRARPADSGCRRRACRSRRRARGGIPCRAPR